METRNLFRENMEEQTLAERRVEAIETIASAVNALAEIADTKPETVKAVTSALADLRESPDKKFTMRALDALARVLQTLNSDISAYVSTLEGALKS